MTRHFMLVLKSHFNNNAQISFSVYNFGDRQRVVERVCKGHEVVPKVELADRDGKSSYCDLEELVKIKSSELLA